MAQTRHLLRLVLVAGIGLNVIAITPSRGQPASSPSYYLSLGDSGAQGYQPIGGPATASAPPGYTHGYSDQLFKVARAEFDGLELVKLACFAESTTTMIAGSGLCAFAAGSQLAEAEAFLATHRDQIAFITLEIGANDILGTDVDCVDLSAGTIDASCVQAALPTTEAQIRVIVERLRAAAPGVPLVAANYADPLLGLWVLRPGPVGQLLAYSNAMTVDAFNAALESAYAVEGVAVADVAGTFATDDFTDSVVTSNWGPLPLNVARVCLWTWFCSKQYPGNVHPNTDGYSVIADTFLAALRNAEDADASRAAGATPQAGATWRPS
jgi:lysophospholipase L1-like esterase